MANESRSVSGSVHVEQDGPSRVAYNLMEKIAAHEHKDGATRDRTYWLTLYKECWRATRGI